MHLLLVEDNRSLSSWLAQALHKSGWAVDCVGDGEAALIALQGQRFDAVILDLGLPRLSGEEVLGRLRRQGSDVPILILTAEGSIQARIDGLNRGADDFLSKPFDLGELEARLRSIQRRRSGQKSPEIHCGSLRLDTNTREFFAGADKLHLTPREHAVLEKLIFNLGKTVSKNDLADSVFELDDETSASTIEVYVSRLRRKLLASDARIFTLRGLGYLLKRSSAGAAETG